MRSNYVMIFIGFFYCRMKLNHRSNYLVFSYYLYKNRTLLGRLLRIGPGKGEGRLERGSTWRALRAGLWAPRGLDRPRGAQDVETTGGTRLLTLEPGAQTRCVEYVITG